MTNKYEERLGTERMLPLVFKMALPAVAAQFVNLLYSIVDRIYIGHIPGIGTDVRMCSPDSPLRNSMAVERDSIIPMFSLRILLACFKS